MVKSRKARPDYYLDPDRGHGKPLEKKTEFVDVDVATRRAGDREGLRDLDSRVEAMANLTRAQKDAARVLPRPKTGELGHARLRRTLPAADVVRKPVSGRQKDARCKARLQAQEKMPLAQLAAVEDMVTTPPRWAQLNNALSDAVGDVESLPATDQRQVRRIDRAIQRFERENSRGHVVYTSCRLPTFINSSNKLPFLANNFAPGDVVSFDRYTAGAHQIHEVSDRDEGNLVIFEMQTRRGAYLGRSGKLDQTAHLLPRGMTFEVAGIHQVQVRDPEGHTSQRTIIQLIDVENPT